MAGAVKAGHGFQPPAAGMTGSMTYCVLSSGSAGNCVWVRSRGTEVLVDCGISARMTAVRLREVGLGLDEVTAAVCSHGHGDHVRGAEVLARRRGVELHGTAETLGCIRGDVPASCLNTVIAGESFTVGGLRIKTVPTMHDAPGSTAFVIDDGESRLGVLTDLGVVTAGVAKAFEGMDGLILEMNHDEQMLLEGPYPWFLKRRIAGDAGHLSNRQAAELLERIAHPGLQHLTLAHLSEENNRPERALEAAHAGLARRGLSPVIAVAGIHAPCEPVVLERSGQLAFDLGA